MPLGPYALSVSEKSIGAILDRLYYEADNQRDKGTAFERLVQAFLRTDPVFAERFDEVWMWSQWPGRRGRPDRGIDLVARRRDGSGMCAVQCKFYDPKHRVTKDDVDSFLAESGKEEFTSRLVVSTTNLWNRAAEATIEGQAVPVNRIGLDDLFNSTLDWDAFSLDEPQELKRVQRKVPREHQREAIAAVTTGLKTSDRGKLVMACGTGKTFTSLRIAERLTSRGGGCCSSSPRSRCSPRRCVNGWRSPRGRSAPSRSAPTPRSTRAVPVFKKTSP